MVAVGLHLGDRVPLPAPPARRLAVRRPERDGRRAAGGRAPGRDPAHAARHLLREQRLRGAARGRAAALLRRRRGARGPARAGDGPAAIHSVRAVPREQLPVFHGRAPLHVHLSEQVAENDACLAAYGVTPTRLLHEADLLGPDTTVVHATHLTDDDIELLGTTGTNVCITPTTERDLADGIGPARRLHDAGCRISIGSDSHAVVDPFEELRGLEMDERLATGERGHWSAAELLGVGTGRPDRGRRPGRPGHPRHRRARGPPAPAPTSTPRSSRPPAPTSRRWWWTAASSTPRTTTRRSGASSTRRSERCGDDRHHRDHPHRRAGHQRPRRRRPARPPARRGARRRGQPGRLGRAGRRGARGRRGGRRRRPGGAARASSTATATWSSRATGRRSSRPGWPGSRTPPAASAPPSPPPAPRPTSSSPRTSPGSCRR